MQTARKINELDLIDIRTASRAEEQKAERNRKKAIYYIKQKACGLGLVLVGIIGFIVEKDITIIAGFVPLGLLIMFTKEKVMYF